MLRKHCAQCDSLSRCFVRLSPSHSLFDIILYTWAKTWAIFSIYDYIRLLWPFSYKLLLHLSCILGAVLNLRELFGSLSLFLVADFRFGCCIYKRQSLDKCCKLFAIVVAFITTTPPTTKQLCASCTSCSFSRYFYTLWDFFPIFISYSIQTLRRFGFLSYSYVAVGRVKTFFNNWSAE